MHKALNQEIQTLKEDLDKREQEMLKFKSLVNSSLAAASVANGNGNGTATALVSAGNLQLAHLNASPMNSTVNLSSYSIASSINHFDETLENGAGGESNQDRLENWLSIPNKRNIKKHGWKKLYVVLRKGKLFFYNSLKDNKESQEPYMTIDLE